MNPVILSPGSVGMRCPLAVKLILSSLPTVILVAGSSDTRTTEEALLEALGARPKLPDTEELLKQALQLSVRYEKAEDYTFLEEPRTAYERRNRNRPWYDRFQKRQRRR